MAVVITDDLDGSANAQTVSFAVDGISYEIDLSSENQENLKKAFAPFIAAARKVRVAGRNRSVSASADRAAVRAWARQAGLAVSERGRISAEIMRKYEAAH